MNRIAAILLLVLFAVAGASKGADVYWTNDAGGFYTNGGNWDGGTVPAITDTVYFTNAASYKVTVDGVYTNTSMRFDAASGIVDLDISAGGQLYVSATSNPLHIGDTRGGVSVYFTNNGSLLIQGGQLNIGTTASSTGNYFLIKGNAVLTNSAGTGLAIGQGGPNNTMMIDGATAYSLGGQVFVGNAVGATGNTLIITNGGKYYNNRSPGIGMTSNSHNNTVIVSGSGSLWECIQSGGNLNANVGYGGGTDAMRQQPTTNQNLIINAGGQVVFGLGCYLGSKSNSLYNSIQVYNTGSSLSTTNLFIGEQGSYNTLIVSNGGFVQNTVGRIGGFTAVANGTNNLAVVTDSGSVWTNRQNLYVGGQTANHNNRLQILNSGAVYALTNYVGAAASNCSTTVSGSGRMDTASTWVGASAASIGNTFVVSGAGSVLNNSGIAVVGYNGTNNSLIVSNGAFANIDGTLYIGTNSVGLGGSGQIVGIYSGATLQLNSIETGFSGTGIISNDTAILQFTNTPTITTNSLSSVIINNGRMRYLNFASVDPNAAGPLSITGTGNSYFSMHSSSNVSMGSYALTNGCFLNGLELTGTAPFWQTTGSTHVQNLLVTNATGATVKGVLRVAGQGRIAACRLTVTP